MTNDSTPNHRDADDAHADGGAPTDAVSDEVKADAARAGAHLDDDEDNTDVAQDSPTAQP